MNTPNPNMPPAQPSGGMFSSWKNTSMMDYVAMLTGGIGGGMLANYIGGGEIFTTLIGAGVGALIGGVVKNWVAPSAPALPSPSTGARQPEGGAGIQRSVGGPKMNGSEKKSTPSPNQVDEILRPLSTPVPDRIPPTPGRTQ